MSVVSVSKLTKVFGTGHTAVKAVDDVNLKVEAGDIILIMGPSGSGKTTLLSMIGSLMRPSNGRVKIEERDITKLSSNQLADLRLKSFGFIFQSFNLLSALTATQNVMVPLVAARVSKKTAIIQANRQLRKFGLGQRLNNLPRDLSGGEKQRVAITRAMANNPKLILADEPTANLDSKTGMEVMRQICETACVEKRAVIIVSHDQRLKSVAKRVITIEDGRLTNEEKGQHDKICTMRRPKHG